MYTPFYFENGLQNRVVGMEILTDSGGWIRLTLKMSSFQVLTFPILECYRYKGRQRAREIVMLRQLEVPNPIQHAFWNWPGEVTTCHIQRIKLQVRLPG